MTDITLKDGTKAEYGDVIRWCCWDNDDCTTWTLTGLYTRSGVVYLGRGIDFGMAIGEEITVDEVLEDSEYNDTCEQGIEKVGCVYSLASYIERYNDNG